MFDGRDQEGGLGPLSLNGFHGHTGCRSDLRQSGACISLFVTLLLVVPLIGFFFPQSWQNDFQRFEPSTLGESMFSPSAPSNSFGAWTATIILTAFVAVVLLIALSLFQRRDAGATA